MNDGSGVNNNIDSNNGAQTNLNNVTVNSVPLQNSGVQGIAGTQTSQPDNQNIANPITNNVNQPPITNKKSNKKLIIIILVVVCLLVGSFFILKGFKGKDKKTNKTIDFFGDDQLIVVQKDGEYGMIDLNGKEVIPFKYKSLSAFYGDYAAAEEIVYGEHNYQRDVYSFIDKEGNSKLEFENIYSMSFIDNINVWKVGYDIYSMDLKKLNPENTEYNSTTYDGDYIVLKGIDDNKLYIMTPKGKVIYEHQYQDNDYYFNIEKSKTTELFKQTYCTVHAGQHKFAIMNCDTGKIVYDFTDYNIMDEGGNIFTVFDSSTYDNIETVYIYDDKVLYTDNKDNIELDYYYNENYIRVSDDDKPYDESITYISIATGEFFNEKPDDLKIPYPDDLPDPWEEYTNLKEISCSSAYGIMSGDKLVVPCEYDDFDYLGLDLYKYLESNGKSYIIAEKDNKYYLIDLKSGKVVKEFATGYLNIENSTFMYYRVDDQTFVYNLLTNKEMEIFIDYPSIYPSYMVIKTDTSNTYYNANLEKIFVEELKK